jgi:alkylhydroperoxidase family enzyme
MSTALANVSWEPCFMEARQDRELEAYARRRMGLPNAAVRYFAAVPWVARTAIDLHVEFGLLVHLDQNTADLVGLIVSQENACRFCFAAVRAVMWFQGMDRERVQHIEQELARHDLPPRVRAAIDYARSQSRTGPSGAHGAWTALRHAGASAAEAREVAFTVATADFANRLHTASAIPPVPMERVPELLPMRLLRPLIERLVRKHRWRGSAVTQVPLVPDAPYAQLVNAFAGSPIAPALARTMNEMWSSPHLSRRCKLLMFGVISRGLPCQVCEIEVSRALQREGLDADAASRILTHLDGPELTPIERLLMPYARETLWYQPAPLQRHTRALREHLSTEQLIEAIGVAALANAVCRMAAVVMAEPA